MKNKSISVDVTIPWGILWLFTIAFAHLSFGKGALAFLIWPYYLGEVIASAVGR